MMNECPIMNLRAARKSLFHVLPMHATTMRLGRTGRLPRAGAGWGQADGSVLEASVDAGPGAGEPRPLGPPLKPGQRRGGKLSCFGFRKRRR